MNKEEVEKFISEKVKEKKGKVISKNVLSAALSIFTNPGNSVEKLFFGVESDLSDEKLKIEQELMLDFVCNIAESIESLKSQIAKIGGDSKSIILDGIIEVEAKNSENVIGVHIKESSNQVEFKPGTKISVKSNGSINTTGLKIGE